MTQQNRLGLHYKGSECPIAWTKSIACGTRLHHQEITVPLFHSCCSLGSSLPIRNWWIIFVTNESCHQLPTNWYWSPMDSLTHWHCCCFLHLITTSIHCSWALGPIFWSEAVPRDVKSMVAQNFWKELLGSIRTLLDLLQPNGQLKLFACFYWNFASF